MYQAFIIFNFFLFTSLIALTGKLACIFSSDKKPLMLTKLADEEPKNYSFPPFSHELALQLQPTFYKLTLPEMRDYIQFLGHSLRPDAKGKILFIKLGQESDIIPLKENEIYYLSYDSSLKSKYQLSDKETPLYIRLVSENDHTVIITLSLKEHRDGGVDAEQKFTIIARDSNDPWLVNDLKVDQTYLVRERAKYCGKDLFLEQHGGDEFAFENERVRIDFEQQEPYALFVKPNDCLVFEENRWINNEEAKLETANRPLMVVKNIDDHFIYFDLFNPLGDQKISLKLIKSRIQNICTPQIVTSQMRFLQAKTWNQYLIELNGERKTLRKGDWLLFIEHKWQLIDDPETIDQYVSAKITAPLFVIDELQKQRGQKIVIGHLFCPTRTEVVLVELLQQNDGNKFKTKTFEEQS